MRQIKESNGKLHNPIVIIGLEEVVDEVCVKN